MRRPFLNAGLMDIAFAHLDATPTRDALTLEYQWLNPARADAPILVFLHEGLGSIAMWKDWPQTLCDEMGARGIVYSRPGYGLSTPRASGEHWPVGYLANQACDILPALLDALDVSAADRTRMWLIGHSDGATIALHFAARFPQSLAGAVVIAPHIFVEQESVDAIRKTVSLYRDTAFRDRLAAYHDDPDSAFHGWSTIWLDPAFRSWNMTNELAAITCPLLSIQAIDDGYATLAHLDTIRENVPHSRSICLENGGHSPHKLKPLDMNAAIKAFIHDTASYRRS